MSRLFLAFSARSQWLSDVNGFDQYCQQNTTDFYKFIEIICKYEARTRSLHGIIINVEQINQTELNHKPLHTKDVRNTRFRKYKPN